MFESDANYMTIRPEGVLPFRTNVLSGLGSDRGIRSFDIRITQQIHDAARQLLLIDPTVEFAAPITHQLAQLLRYLRSRDPIPSFIVNDLAQAHRNGAIWLKKHTPESSRTAALRAWDGLCVLCNLYSDVSGLLLSARAGHDPRCSICSIAGSSGTGFSALATYELPGVGPTATEAKLPYVRNLWSGVPGGGTELLRFVRDVTGSEEILVKPLSAAAEDYYRRHHRGELYLASSLASQMSV